jgi:tRNA (guanosine-2'-O-)-methyltransferase
VTLRADVTTVGRAARVVLVFGLAVVGCASRGSTTREASLTPTRIEGPPDVQLIMACTPTGPELCFNAVDDNCNGVIDEGCGVGTGVLQFTIAWGDSVADVDIVVTEPSGVRVFEGNRTSPSGMHLDRDCPGESCNGQNIENVFFEGLDPPRGKYLVEVRLADLHGAPTPVHVRFGARIGTRTIGADLSLTAADEKKTFPFEL